MIHLKRDEWGKVYIYNDSHQLIQIRVGEYGEAMQVIPARVWMEVLFPR